MTTIEEIRKEFADELILTYDQATAVFAELDRLTERLKEAEHTINLVSFYLMDRDRASQLIAKYFAKREREG